MGNQTYTVQSNIDRKHSGDDKCTSSSDSHPNFEDLQDFETQSIEDNKFFHFLDQSFKEKKIASKQIQFKIIDQNNITKKKPILQEHSSSSNLEETQQYLNQKSYFYSQMEDMNSLISQQSYFSANNQSYQFYLSLGDKITEKQDLMTRSSFSSYRSKYKQLNIRNSNFVKVRNLKFQDFYQNLQKIGQGATGRVFTARCKMTNQIRAVKVLKNKFMKRMRSKQTLHSELDMLKTFDHPNIIKVYDVFCTQNLYYVVTEYCSGGTLQEYVTNNKRLDPKLVKIIFRQLLTVLCYLHSLSVIHRDIKMDNIVFKTNPKQCQNLDDVQIKIIDFGLAKKAKYKALNKDTPCLGTPLYMAPQIMKGHYSQKCDIWASGVILHYLLFNQFPFQSGEVQFVYKKITSQQINFTKPYWKKIPNDARILLQSMLQKNGARRITACDALKSQWFSESITNKGTRAEKDLIYQKLTSYKKENNFISIIESYIIFAKSTRDPRHQKLVKLFHKFDQNNNGCLEVHELQQIQKQNIFLNKKREKFEVRQMVAKIDKNKSGKIEISEFLSLFVDRNELFTQECLKNAFDFFDQDKDGSINRQELEKMLQGCDVEQFKDMWRDLDTDKDNKISKMQFIKYLKRLNDEDMQQSSTKSIKIRKQ